MYTASAFQSGKLDKFFEYLSKEKSYAIIVKFVIQKPQGSVKLRDFIDKDYSQISEELADKMVFHIIEMIINSVEKLKEILTNFLNVRSDITFRSAKIQVCETIVHSKYYSENKEKYCVKIKNGFLIDLYNSNYEDGLLEIFKEVPNTKMRIHEN